MMGGNEAVIGVGIVLGWEDGRVIVDELASGWPAALTYKIAIGDQILAGPFVRAQSRKEPLEYIHF
jgi:hypothetical protein